MRRFWACYCTLSLLAVWTAAAQEVLVGFDRAASARTAALADAPTSATLRTLGLREAGQGRRLARRGPLADVVAVAVPDSAALRRALAAWATVPGVRFVQPNHRYRLDTVTPVEDVAPLPTMTVGGRPLADVPWDSLAHLVAVGAREAQRITTGARRVRVAFLDTGLWFEHPALAHAAWTNPGEIPGNGIDDDGNGFVDDVRGWDFVDRVGSTGFGDVRGRDNDPSDDNTPGSSGRGHGTSVAGVVAARYLAPTAATGPGFAYGIAPDVSLVPLRVCAADGGCDDDDVAAALVYAGDMGFEVANLSFGSDYVSQVLRDAVAYAVAKGVLVVASAGNQPVARAHYPSDYPGVVSAAWLTQDGTARASGAQFGPGVTLGAPASVTPTTVMPLPEQAAKPGALYGRLSGSSFAAPLVAGAAALLLSQDATLSAASLRSILTATADDLGTPGWDEQTGAGRLRIDRALLRSLPARLSIDSPEQDGGTSAARVPIVGTVLDPSFVSYDVFYAAGDFVIAHWSPIASDQTTPKLRGELAVWNTAGLADGVYTLRLSLLLREGQRIEERRRVWLDRTAPRVTVVRALAGYQDDRYAALYEVTTDDLTRLDASCSPTPSDRIARRHGLVAALDVPLAGAPADARCTLTATNRSGMTTRVDAPLVAWPAVALDPALLRETPLAAPSGILLPRLTDFDGDGRAEVTLNRADGEATTDTTLVYEWTGAGTTAGLALVQRLVVDKSSARPRDAGDTDGDGRAELLLQSGGSSGVAEAATVGGFPSALAFVSPDTLFAARFTDLDRDGRGEILGHNGRAWRVYEWNGATFARVASLPNPTPPGTGEVRENLYSEPEAAVGDFDGDGLMEFAVADLDGDIAVFEARGDNTYVPTWQDASDRYASRPKMAVGDLDGDGRPEFVVQRENFEAARSTDRQQEPPIATFTAFTATGNDIFRALGSVSFPLPPTRYSATATLDLDGDGRDELAVAVGARLYVFSWTPEGFRLRFVRSISGRGEGADGLRSVTLATGDLDGDGRPDLVAAMGTGQLSLFTSPAPSGTLAAPEIVHASPNGAGAVLLGWRAGASDSTVLYRRRSAADPLERVASVPRCCALASVAAPPGTQTYAVRAWRGGVASPFSAARTFAPGPASARLVSRALRADTSVVRLDVTLPFSTDDLSLLDLSVWAVPPGSTDTLFARTILPATAFTGFLAIFDRRVPDGATVGLRGAGSAVLQGSTAAPRDGLLVVRADVLAPAEVRLVFNQPLDASSIAGASFVVAPAGEVVSATLDPSNPSALVLRLRGAVAGATGLATSITASGLRSASGERLNAEGSAVRLSAAAVDLSGAYVFPNPVRPADTPEGAMVAGLPREADVTVLSVDGRLIRRLEERDGDGGVRWDVRDDAGRDVPSGVYFVRITTPDGHSRLVRVAVLR